MSAEEETEAESAFRESDPDPNPDDSIKKHIVVKDAREQMGTLDVHVCGRCHSVFHFVEQFAEHRDSVACSGKSPVRDSSESKHQVWAFMLWKCSTVTPEVGANRSWKLYQQWCKMDEAQRGAWIAAGKTVQTLSKYANSKPFEAKSPSSVDMMSPGRTAGQSVYSGRKRGRPSKKEQFERGRTSKKDEDFLPPSSGETDDESSIKEDEKKPRSRVKNENTSKISDYITNLAKLPPEGRIARRTERKTGQGDVVSEYVVEKILAKRFNMRKKQHEYLIKWEACSENDNTWEPSDHLNTCSHLLEAFEKQLARQKEIKALRAARAVAKAEIDSQPTFTPTGRLQRNSKAKAMDQVKAWCGAEMPPGERIGGSFSDDEPLSKRVKKEPNSSGEDMDFGEKNVVNGASRLSEAELVKSLGIGSKMPQIKGVIKVDPKEMPNLTTGVYIMSKNSGIMRLDSPGKLSPGLNIDQEMIRKQILAAKQAASKKGEMTPGIKINTYPSKGRSTTPAHARTPGQIIEKTIVTPSGQKIIQRSIQRTPASGGDTILNKLSPQDQNLLRRVAAAARGRGGRGPSQIIRVRERSFSNLGSDGQMNGSEEESSDEDYNITDPFPRDLPPIPPPSPDRDLTLCPLTGKRLARAEGEPTPPPTPPPAPTPPPLEAGDVVMKVEMSPGGTTGTLVGNAQQPSLPQLLVDDDGDDSEAGKVVKRLLSVEDADALSGNEAIMIQGDDGVLYQVAGKNEAGQTLLVAAEGVDGSVEGMIREDGGEEGSQCVYVAQQEGGEVLAIDSAQLAQFMPEHAGDGLGEGLRQVAVQVEGEAGEESTQVIAQLVQADLPSPGGTRKVVLLLPDGSFTMTELDSEQYASITEGDKGPEN